MDYSLQTVGCQPCGYIYTWDGGAAEALRKDEGLMSGTPTYLHSVGSPQTVTLKDGRELTLRNGCLVNEQTREVVTGSRETTAYVLKNCELTDDERLHWKTWGNILCDRMNSQPSSGQCGSGIRRSNRVVERMEAA